jgi:DNA-binding NarL/FixJ family response regulator
MEQPATIRILIVGSSPLARAGVAALLHGAPGLVVAGQAAETDLPDAIGLFRAGQIVWDMGWDPLAHLDRLHEIGGDGPPVLALVADVKGVFGALPVLTAAGVRGVLGQETSGAALHAAVAALDHGLLVLPALAFAGDALRAGIPAAETAPIGTARAESTVPALTPREAEVLRLIAEGLPNKTIGAMLHISEHTVKFHVNALLTKLNAQSRTDAVVRATRAGLLSL